MPLPPPSYLYEGARTSRWVEKQYIVNAIQFFFYAKKFEALMPNNRFKILAQRSLNAGVKQNALVLYLRLLFA